MNALPDPVTLALPPLVQIGFVVRDLAASMAAYERLYGPWQRFDGSVPQASYRGRSADVHLDIAIGHSGTLEIELIQWLSGDSPHREFIERGREGMHHLQYRVPDAGTTIAALHRLGYQTKIGRAS